MFGTGLCIERPDSPHRLAPHIKGELYFAFGDRDETDNGAGFDYDTYGITGGVDYGFTDQVYAGIALGYETSNDDYDDDGGELDKDTFTVSLYGTVAPTEQSYVDATAAFSWINYDLERHIQYATFDRTATGDTDGFEYALSLGGGYDFLFGAVTAGPYAQVNYIDTDVDGFRESGAQGLNLTYDDRSIDALNSILGGRVSRSFSADFGVISVEARAEWQHEFQDDAQSVTAFYTADPNQVPLIIVSDEPDRNFFNLGIGAVATLPQGITTFADFQALVGHELVNDYTFTVGGRFEF
jgi:outer membrane autotransporter protein